MNAMLTDPNAMLMTGCIAVITTIVWVMVTWAFWKAAEYGAEGVERLGKVIATSALLTVLSACAQPQQAPVAPTLPLVQLKTETPKVVVPDDPFVGLPEQISWAIRHGMDEPVQVGITTYYDYSPDQIYAVNCDAMKVTDIRLKGDEETNKDDVVLGDDKRWGVDIGDGVVMVKPLGITQTVISEGPQPLVRPADPVMVTSLDIKTDKRSYHLMLHERKPWTPSVAFYYPSEVLKQADERKVALTKEVQQ